MKLQLRSILFITMEMVLPLRLAVFSAHSVLRLLQNRRALHSRIQYCQDEAADRTYTLSPGGQTLQ